MSILINVSKSREKSYGTNTQTAPKQQKQQYFFLLCLGASLCNSGLLAGAKMSPEVSGSDPKWSLSGGPKIQPYQQGEQLAQTHQVSRPETTGGKCENE